MGKCHVLKTDPLFFLDSWDEIKQFEVRFDDRNFKTGDTLFLAETRFSSDEMKNGKPLEYTGRLLNLDIEYKLIFEPGLQKGWCILGTALISSEELDPFDNDFLGIIEA